MSPTNGPIGVSAALTGATPPARSIFADFALVGRVAVITGAHRGIGLEQALALAEAGALVYCLDLPPTPDEEWRRVQKHVASLPGLNLGVRFEVDYSAKPARLDYVCVDVTDQKAVWRAVERIAEREKRMDICIACAGIIGDKGCLDYSAEEFQKVSRLRN